MRLLKLAAAALLSLGTIGALSIPAPDAAAEAQRHYRGDGHRHWRGRHWCGDRHGHRRVNGRYCRRGDWRGRDSYRRRGAVCHDVWRDGYRVPVCRY